MADRKSRKMIRYARRLNPNACICAMGCFIQTNKDAINISEADILLGNNNKGLAVEKVLDFLKNRKRFVEINDITKEKVYDNLRASEFDQTRAFIKIEDGCQNFCSYCIIPYARGPVRSKPIDDCIAEIKEIAANGYEEIDFTGIDT
jgi:threonylcarbamoyladenosine tRNA methylthiotransferase MtaB